MNDGNSCEINYAFSFIYNLCKRNVLVKIIDDGKYDSRILTYLSKKIETKDEHRRHLDWNGTTHIL